MRDHVLGRRSGALVVVLLLGHGCGWDGESPTAPEPGAPLAVTAAQTLSFVQVSAGDAHS